MATVTAKPEKKKSSFGCCLLKVLAVFLVLGLIAGGVVVMSVVRTFSWVENGKEEAPATYPQLVISPGEKEDVEGVMQRIWTAKEKKEMIDETVTDNVFNGIIAAIQKDERAKGKSSDIEDFRGGFEGDHFHVAFTSRESGKDGKTKYVNCDATFDLEVEDGKIVELKMERVSTGAGEAPFLVRTGAKWFLSGMKDGINNGTFRDKDGQPIKIMPFKLIKREGQRLHVIVDMSQFNDSSSNAPAPKPAGTKEVDKTDF